MYNPFTIENKTILVLGASSGIGKATAIICSKMGANVIIAGRNQERLQDTLKEFTFPYMGIEIIKSHFSRISREIPLPSLPTTIAVAASNLVS